MASTRLWLSFNLAPVFVPAREPGFQASIEAFNCRWQAKALSRLQHTPWADLAARSDAYVAATRARSTSRSTPSGLIVWSALNLICRPTASASMRCAVANPLCDNHCYLPDRPGAPYWMASVTPLWLAASPITSLTGTALPDGPFSGISTFTWRTPATLPGAAPA